MHTHGYDLKKRGAFIRMGIRRRVGREIPDYGYRLGGFPLSRRILEFAISGLFAVLGTRIARRCIQCVSPRFMGKVFVHLRTLWKKATHGIKARELQR
jgi:hypothetical protein